MKPFESLSEKIVSHVFSGNMWEVIASIALVGIAFWSSVFLFSNGLVTEGSCTLAGLTGAIVLVWTVPRLVKKMQKTITEINNAKKSPAVKSRPVKMFKQRSSPQTPIASLEIINQTLRHLEIPDLINLTKTCKFFHQHINADTKEDNFNWKFKLDTAYHGGFKLSECIEQSEELSKCFNKTNLKEIPVIFDLKKYDDNTLSINFKTIYLSLLPLFEKYKTPYLAAQDKAYQWHFFIRVKSPIKSDDEKSADPQTGMDEEITADGILVYYQDQPGKLSSWGSFCMGLGEIKRVLLKHIKPDELEKFLTTGATKRHDYIDDKDYDYMLWRPSDRTLSSPSTS